MIFQAKNVIASQNIQTNPVGAAQMKVSSPRQTSSTGVSQMKISKKQLPPEVQLKMEDSFNEDFSDVQIGESEQVAEMGAVAYAQGNQINFAPGQFKPNTENGQKVLGHELAHIIQQRKGQVKPTGTRAGMPVNENTSLEKEADVMGDKAAKHDIEANVDSSAGAESSTQMFTLGLKDQPKRR